MMTSPQSPAAQKKILTTGLSANEAYCLKLKGLSPGNLVVGNSVISLGVKGLFSSGLKTLMGGEVTEVTQLIHEGRETAYERMVKEAQHHGGVGITGVSNDLIFLAGAIEYLSIGSCVHKDGATAEKLLFSTAEDGQDLYCQLDSGFIPHKFVFGNIAYSIGLGGGIAGILRGFQRGEVKEFTDIFNTTRHQALERIMAQARSTGANAVVSIETSILPMVGMQEMVMIGTAAKHPALESAGISMVTCDLTSAELWNAIHMGYMPLRLVMGVSVYSIGFAGGIASGFKTLVRGEIHEMTSLIYEARERAIEKLHREAVQYGADSVLGIKTYVYQLGGGLIEFFAIGTAVKKMPSLTTLSPQLPPQAIIVDRDTFVNGSEGSSINSLNEDSSRPGGRIKGGMGGLIGIVIFFVYITIIILAKIFGH